MDDNHEEEEALEEEEVPQEVEETDKKKRKHKVAEEKFSFNIPGVYRRVLNDVTQQNLGIVAGKDVTDEKPWIYVEKENFLYEFDANGKGSQVIDLMKDVKTFKGKNFLVGYISDDSKDYDEYYLCMTKNAIAEVEVIRAKMEKQQQERLYNSIWKPVESWETLGSENEIEENIPRNTRPLIVVELESKYPIWPYKIEFRLRRAEDCRDGYMELRTPEEVNIIIRKRIDNFAQVTPPIMDNVAQTNLKYPMNEVTQYEYDPSIFLKKAGRHDDTNERILDLIGSRSEKLVDFLRVNGVINFYRDDYNKLVSPLSYHMQFIPSKPKEFVCLINQELCQNKTIADVSWNPFQTGILVISYVDIPNQNYYKERPVIDYVSASTHGHKPILVWCITNDLVPKLILGSPREVYAVSYCPWNENLIIGGLCSGQIILWDITNKIAEVEDEEILTANQQRYRLYMNSLMTWMKNIHDPAKVRPTVISDAKFSHKGRVNKIRWLSPEHKLTKTGKFEAMPPGKTSLQLITGAEDGYLLIWDLYQTPEATGGAAKQKKSKRLQRKPSALAAATSPFKALHLQLKPIYKLIFMNPALDLPYRVTSFDCFYNHPKFVRVTPGPISSIFQRIQYKIECFEPTDAHKNACNIFAGTHLGDFMHVKWEGLNFESSEPVNFEPADVISLGRWHDGPVARVEYCHELDLILALGGTILSIWSPDFKDYPVLWRKATANYTDGGWFLNDCGKVKAVRSDGNLEIWIFHHQSYKPFYLILISADSVNKIAPQSRDHKYKFVGCSVASGLLRLFYVTQTDPLLYLETLRSLFKSEIERKKSFIKWQKEFNAKYAEFLPERKAAVKIEPATVENEFEEEEDKKTSGTAAALSKKIKKESEELQKIRQMIIKKKQLDPEQLQRDREPLIQVALDIEQRRKKQRTILRSSDRIFNDTVAMLFPDVIKEKPPPAPDPYKDVYTYEEKKAQMEIFKKVSIQAQDHLDNHQFEFYFDWMKILKIAKQKQRVTKGYYSHPHFIRTLARIGKDVTAEYRPVDRFASLTSTIIDFGEGEEEEEEEDEDLM